MKKFFIEHKKLIYIMVAFVLIAMLLAFCDSIKKSSSTVASGVIKAILQEDLLRIEGKQKELDTAKEEIRADLQDISTETARRYGEIYNLKVKLSQVKKEIKDEKPKQADELQNAFAELGYDVLIFER